MNAKISLVALMLLVATARADSPEWREIASTPENDYIKEVKKGSYELSRNKADEEIAIVTGRTLSGLPSSRRIFPEKWYVRTSDCERGAGKVVTLTPSGEFLYENDFVEGAGNIASATADVVCLIYTVDKRVRRSKGM